uniref:Uncharacterized protein n=1 Tax=Canis lupus familiaris TaxID=9615 RepID=A0A8I3MTT5_CANLF
MRNSRLLSTASPTGWWQNDSGSRGFCGAPGQSHTKFHGLGSRYRKGRGEVHALSSSWASAPKEASCAVPGQEGRATEAGELSQQEGEPMEAGEGAWTDGAARDGKTSRILTGKELPPLLLPLLVPTSPCSYCLSLSLSNKSIKSLYLKKKKKDSGSLNGLVV